jgi:hypothetical protein
MTRLGSLSLASETAGAQKRALTPNVAAWVSRKFW